MTSRLDALLASRLHAPAPDAVSTMASHVRRNHKGVCAVLAYGSALRDSAAADTLIDLYVLVGKADGISPNPVSRLACRLAPPNVYYAELVRAGQTLRAKYAVLTISQLQARVGPDTANPYFWARFAQPTRLVWRDGESVENRVLAIIARACRTAFANAIATAPDAPPLQQWAGLFRQTYRTELRPEPADRAGAIVDADRAYYEGLTAALKDAPAIHPNWAMRRMTGKLLSILRLAKAAFTFQGGADYIAWKIKRHSGVEIEVTDFQRRHPLLAGIILLPKLLRKGAVR